ncbi:MAG: hypothetical protein ACRDFS_01010 [Chloroflexota bacterium]
MGSDERPDFRIPLFILVLLAAFAAVGIHLFYSGVPLLSIPSAFLQNPVFVQAQVTLQPFLTWVGQIQSMPTEKKILMSLGVICAAGAAALAPFFLWDIARGTPRRRRPDDAQPSDAP